LTEDKKKISLWQRLREKYRISVLDEKTLAEHWYLHLSGWGAIVVVAILFLLSLALFSLVILYTPIKHYLPGYSEDIRQELLIESARVDSLGTSLELQRQYLNIIKQVVAGEVHTDTVQSLDSMQIIMREQLLEAKNEATAEFIAQYEAMGKDNMQLFSNNRTASAPTLAFFTPVHGSITQHFSQQEKRYAITIQTLENKNVNAVLNGTIIYLNHEINDVYTVIIKHTNYLSIYRGLKNPLKSLGQVVQTGECIGLTANQNIEFELWQDEQAVDPEQLIVF
jgi:murein DD-endopeptidase MepM/ murein hydrolase activator NlpD